MPFDKIDRIDRMEEIAGILLSRKNYVVELINGSI
jgi:hypothetical protein